MRVSNGRKRKLFQQTDGGFHPYRLMFWGVMILIGFITLRNIQSGEIQPLFQPTPTPTRSAASYRAEGSAFFEAGNLGAAIQAYQDALVVDPADYVGWTDLARIQTYSASLLTQGDKRQRLAEARESIANALDLAPNDAAVNAVNAFVLDWSAGAAGSAAERQAFLAQASTAAIRAVQLDSRNVYALAYQAEVFADQQQYTQAFQYAQQALSLNPNLMDVRRVNAYVNEATGDYAGAIEEYKAATEIAPNLTFLYISIGQNYRQLALYDEALEYFDQAATINEALGIQDPLPYVAIAKTYTRMGEFFAAALNAERAIDFDPTNADLYGQLGHIRFQARNYEGAVAVLRCAVEGCTAEENEERWAVEVEGLELTDASVVYYYVYTSATSSLDECEIALPVIEQIEAVFADNSLVMAITSDNRGTCALLAEQDG